MWFSKRKSIAEKLVEIVAEMPRLTKNGQREDFNYLEISDLANAFYGCAKSKGLIVVPNDLEAKISDDGNNAWVKTEFEVTDGEYVEFYSSYGSGFSQGKWGGLPIAQTMALKAFLKRLGMMFGEEDGAEFQQNFSHETFDAPLMHTPPSMVEKANGHTASLEELGRSDLAEKIAAQEVPEGIVSSSDARKFNAACKSRGITPKQRHDWLQVNCGVGYISDVKSTEGFAMAMRFAEGKESLEDSLAASVQAAQSKPMAIVEDQPEDFLASGQKVPF